MFGLLHCYFFRHSSVKPVEPENITGNLTKEEAPSIVEVKKFLFLFIFYVNLLDFWKETLKKLF